MTDYPDKPKRKEKSKNRQSWRTQLIVLVSAIVVIAGIGVYILFPQSSGLVDAFHAPDGDPFTPLCQFEADVYLYVPANDAKFIKKLGEDTVHLLGDSLMYPVDSHAGSPYVWFSGSEDYVYNLQTHKSARFGVRSVVSGSGSSNTNRFWLSIRHYEDGDINNVMIYDAQSQDAILDIDMRHTSAYWSPDDHYVLFFNADTPGTPQLFDTATQALTEIDLPYGVETILGWADENNVLFYSIGGYIRIWDIQTGDIANLIEVGFQKDYYAGGTPFAQNFSAELKPDQPLAFVGDDKNLYIIPFDNPKAPNIIPIDLSRPMQFESHAQFVTVSYGENQDEVWIYYVDDYPQKQLSLPDSAVNVQLSPDGHFVAYSQTDMRGGYTVMDLSDDETMTFETAYQTIFGWRDINGVMAIQYNVQTEDDAQLFYLFQPETRTTCKLGTFYSHSIELIVMDNA